VTNDEQAQKFFNLFWGKRHPDYQKTAQNVFRTRFDALVAEADKRFTLGKKRGALTERGKVLILLGPPKAIASKLESAGTGVVGAEREEDSFPRAGGNVVVIQFQYDKEQLPEWAGMKSFLVNFTVDERAERETADKTGDIKKLWKKAIAAAVVNPKMTEPPVYKTREEYEAEMKAAAEAAAEAAKGPVLSAPVRASLEALLAKEPRALSLFPLAYGTRRPPDGPALRPGLCAPAGTAGAAPEGMKLALLVRGKDGKDAARREEPVVLQKVREDWFVDVALPVDAGEYQVAALLLDASGAEKVSAHRPVTVIPLPSELAMSPLLLACTDIAADGRRRRSRSSSRPEVRREGRRNPREDRRPRLRGPGLQPRRRPRDEEAPPQEVDLDQAEERLHDRRAPAAGRADDRAGAGRLGDRPRHRPGRLDRRREPRRLFPSGRVRHDAENHRRDLRQERRGEGAVRPRGASAPAKAPAAKPAAPKAPAAKK
jgi:hypothetical protein